MTVGVVVFPGSNCDRDLAWALEGILEIPCKFLWHANKDLEGAKAIVLPGGFSYGDYLRCGALARFAPLLEEVRKFAEAGGPVLGICNGFQILTEMGLLPGALTRNRDLHFICEPCNLVIGQSKSQFIADYQPNKIINLPIAHGEGRYFCNSDTHELLEQNNQVLLRYQANPNGSVGNIAGISNKAGNVVGMMPHPERACDPQLGGTDGQQLLRALVG